MLVNPRRYLLVNFVAGSPGTGHCHRATLLAAVVFYILQEWSSLTCPLSGFYCRAIKIVSSISESEYVIPSAAWLTQAMLPI